MIDPDNIDYQKMGFKAGLEIHHQLKSKRKLFCHCPADLDADLQKHPQFTFHRRFRAVMGEMGDFDPGMLVEVEKGYLVIYHGNDDHVCTYEMDETPPFWLDMESVDSGYHLAALFNCTSPSEEVVINRKQYLDGSITTGFQRTMIIARDGHIELRSGKKVKITNILIEEDSARKIKTEDNGRTVYYNLDRLGVPLTEIITDHLDVDDPETLVETARMIGLNLRTTILAKRGIGVARQDVNISITGGDRAELKGVQDLGLLPKYCAHEVCRQQALIDIQIQLASSQLEKEKFQHTYIDISHLFDDLGEGEKAYCIRLPGFEEYLNTEIQPGKDFGFEIFEKCNLITGIHYYNMFHSGEASENSVLNRRGTKDLLITQGKDNEIREVLSLEPGDGYIAAMGPEKPVLHTMKISIERCKQAFDGVPQETRRVLHSGNNEFLRVIHGKGRLYPDTDTPPEPYPMEKFEVVKKKIAPRPMELFRKYEAVGLSFTNLELLIRDEKVPIFQKLVDEIKAPVSLAVQLTIEIPRWLRRKGKDPEGISHFTTISIAGNIMSNKIPRKHLRPMMKELCMASKENHDKIIAKWICHNNEKDKENKPSDQWPTNGGCCR
ncbi:MAG: Glu-tRNA(Gln) amidotransferase subunit GatE [Thermoplasmata archaeon]|nr:Glu-tRNA(Gln) amidotransferase subunit GatE [Thermoplasmata archaeon]